MPNVISDIMRNLEKEEVQCTKHSSCELCRVVLKEESFFKIFCLMQ